MAGLVSAGVFPVHKNKFEFDISATETAELVVPKGLEEFSPSFEANIEEWYAMEDEGWASSLKTGMKWGLTLNGKRIIGDPGNDFLADKLMAIGQDAYVDLTWTMPSGMKIVQQMTIEIKNVGGGSTTDVGALEISLTSNGKPTVTPAA